MKHSKNIATNRFFCVTRSISMLFPLTLNQWVEGSSPSGDTQRNLLKIKHLGIHHKRGACLFCCDFMLVAMFLLCFCN